ncbi:hypothetical protein ACUIJN_11925 [Metabacillus halosaccharovorans]|uniref:hypothetical protein n=1 Tax=Metabacillus halosaccharovorans TaxID=930124 RepID=UPI00403DC4D8
MKIQMIELKELDIYEEDGEYKQRFINTRKIPACLTNYSLKLGKDLGLLEGSLIADLLQLQGLNGFDEIEDDPEKAAQVAEAAEQLDQVKYLKVIYLACIGLNKNLELSFDEFVSLYHESMEDMLNTYAELVTDIISSDKNQFAQGLKASTKKNKKEKKK